MGGVAPPEAGIKEFDAKAGGGPVADLAEMMDKNQAPKKSPAMAPMAPEMGAPDATIGESALERLEKLQSAKKGKDKNQKGKGKENKGKGGKYSGKGLSLIHI